MNLYSAVNSVIDSSLKARISDCIDLCENRGAVKFLGFFDEQKSAVLKVYLQSLKLDCVFFGGFDNAERLMLGFFPDYYDESEYYDMFPITALTFSYNDSFTLTHRDFLGSIMALGIKRDKIGDILVGQGLCVTFVDSSVAKYILEQICKVGRVGVSIKTGFDALPQSNNFADVSSVISSPRLDCIVSVLIGKSREKVKGIITAQAVSINHIVCTETSQKIENGDIISVKGCGRFIIDSVDEHTKKDRIKLKARKYL